MTPLVLLLAAVTVPSARTYPFPETEVKRALEQLGAFEDAPLPMLEGFVTLSTDQLRFYDRPHYQFRAELKTAGERQTEVVVEARISARFTAGPAARPEYRALSSSGRLEADLFDRLAQQLVGGAAPSASEVAAVRAQADAAERQRAALERELRELEPLSVAPAAPVRVVAVAAGTAVLEHPAAAAQTVFRAEPEDELELVADRGAWVEVRTTADSTGWIRRAKLAADAEPEPPPEFIIDREEIGAFAGEWVPLQGRKALFLWVRAGAHRPRWGDVKRLFADRYRMLEHMPSGVPRPSGLVVIFGGPSTVVAAATLADARGWLDGAISERAFFERCSLDPQDAFQELEISGSKRQ